MGKKGKGKQSGSPAPTPAPGQSSSKGGKKGAASGSGPGAASTSTSASASASEALPPVAPPKPTVKQIIGGQSWTGKLPVTLLQEHVQKQGWFKPDYGQQRNADDFSCFVTLSSKDAKTQELMRLDAFKIPPSHKHLLTRETALESKHAAATYALFRVCSMQNKHTVLPPDYKALWKQFEELKKQDVKEGRGWMYDADPFKTLRERQEAKAAAEKKHKEIEGAKARAKDMPGASGLVLRQHAGEGGAGAGSLMKGWTNVPKVEMGRKTRASLEALLRENTVWNPHGVAMSQPQKDDVVAELGGLGFRRSHVEEAVEYCKDREETLEWLLIHVPEDDMPPWALPESYSAGISVGATDLKKESTLKRLAETGYSLELCGRVYEENGGDEARTAEALQRILLGEKPAGQQTAASAADLLAQGDASEHWEEEVSSLEAVMGGEDVFRESEDVVKVRLDISRGPHAAGAGGAGSNDRGKGNAKEDGGRKDAEAFVVQMRRSPNYPSELVVGIVANLPSYIKLSIVKQTLEYVSSSVADEPMKMFYVTDWLQHQVRRIIEKPGRLLDISAVSSAASETKAAAAVPDRSRQPQQKMPRFINWTPVERSRQDWLKRQERADWKNMASKRQRLPAWKVRDRVVRTVLENHVTIISGETGSGKSTQSMQYVLDDLYSRGLGDCAHMIITQPRRISALGLADRVAEERCCRVGDEIGYAIRGESRRSNQTRMTFVTTGVLLRRLQVSGGNMEDVVASLADVSHVVIDEVHERSLDTDFLLTLLREVLGWRKDMLKLVLMSATLDAATFEDYFRSQGLRVGSVEIEGRTFPVEDYYLDDLIRMTGFGLEAPLGADIKGEAMGKAIQKLGPRVNYGLVAEAVEVIDAELSYSDDPGGILIFLPGVADITHVCNMLRSQPSLHVLPLHASLETREQKRVFDGPPPKKRKVVVATNVAETSITIDDIVVVIDSGKVKQTTYDAANNMRRLEETWASRAACKQRKGRAGRVQAGKCFKLYTRSLEQTQMEERPEPEIRRVPLEQLCLSVRAMGMRDVAAFLGRSPSPPSSLAVEGAVKLLRRMGVLDGDELTAMGQQLAMIPADLRCGKLMVYGSIFGCLDECVTVAAILSTRSPFVAPQEKRDQAREARLRFSTASGGSGDVLTDLEAFRRWDSMMQTQRQGAVRDFCTENFISFQSMSDIAATRAQYCTALSEIGISSPWLASSLPSSLPSHTSASVTPALMRALLAAAFAPQVARIQFPDKKFAASISGAVELDPEARTIKYFSQDNGRVFVHPGSTLFGSQGFPGHATYMSYFSIINTSKVFIRDLTPFNAYSLLMFSGSIDLDTLGRGLVVDGWLKLRGWARIGVLVARLRSMVDDVIAQKVENPGLDVAKNRVLKAVVKLVELDGLDA